jgi:hypothetical protein
VLGPLEGKLRQRRLFADAEPTAGHPRSGGPLADAGRARQQYRMRCPAVTDAVLPPLGEFSLPNYIH